MNSKRIQTAFVVAVGDELLAGAHPDLNGPFLARSLGQVGVGLAEVRVVPDDVDRIAATVREAVQVADLVLVTGGLGPTLDDVTRDGLALAAGVESVTDPRALRGLKDWYASRDLPMPPSNLRQAEFPRGAILVTNSAGTAPGFRLQLDDSWVVSLPGPPRELKHVFDEEVLPWLRTEGLVGDPIVEHKLFLFGVPEGVFAERAGAWMGREADPLISCSAKSGSLWINLRARDSQTPGNRARLDRRLADLRHEFGSAIYSESEARLELVLGQALLGSDVSFCTAESCTGGRVAALITGVPGISAVFERGYVTYADAAKRDLLGVQPELLDQHGAVSEEVAGAMAQGAAQAAGSRLSVAVTGIAGPAGGSEEKPVGLVCFATCLDGEVETFHRIYPPLGRDWVREVSAQTALWRSWLRLEQAGLLPVSIPAAATSQS